jgi:hypothetical protein
MFITSKNVHSLKNVHNVKNVHRLKNVHSFKNVYNVKNVHYMEKCSVYKNGSEVMIYFILASRESSQVYRNNAVCSASVLINMYIISKNVQNFKIVHNLKNVLNMKKCS